MSSDMTHVYSGGLMYEYTMEPNNFGIVKVEGGDVGDRTDQTGKREELPEFQAFADALKKFPAPTGDGGASTEEKTSECPPRDDEHWDFDPKRALPTIPEGAKKVCSHYYHSLQFFQRTRSLTGPSQFFEKGAGPGPGLKGPGSQWAVDQASTSDGGSTGTGSGTGTSDNASETSKNAAMRGSMPAFDSTPFFISGAALLFTLVGAFAL
jgi:hypothetical protein